MKQCDGTMSMQLDNGAEQHNMQWDNTAQQCDGIQCNNATVYNATMQRDFEYATRQMSGTT